MLLVGTFGFVAGALVLFWWLFQVHPRSFVVSGAFYVWVKLYTLLLVSQFWLTG
ncbi:MAG: MFS transporter, partial [Gemmatimonadetes bacterium]|nr:MFS transporter [Gemmatimonadota bacterium]NIT89653.1 MFS transporter [Gemmatimonadota bacterium]NIU33430.1 MFS transporter [Gemmatimonadota bacterium]NIU37721.1 MFS transporter [Gemmatimonadota bacterium]NIV63768.1 MFS transporter [Gemmatimonadota bacterium]